jgi:LytS/YehU family sensor histidine kinase
MAAALLLLALATLQVSPLADLGFARLDSMLVLAIAWGALSGPRGGAAFGLATGLSEDLLLGGGLTYAVGRTLLGLLAGLVRPSINLHSTAIVIPLVALATVAQESLLALLHRDLLHLAHIWLAAVTGNCLIAWPIYVLARLCWSPNLAAPATKGG